MDLYQNLDRDQAKAELKRWRAKAGRLADRINLANENLIVAQDHMEALKARIKVAPAPREYY
jgi:hypothetical protein